MSQFKVYFQLGMEHILDIEGYDHMLFLVALLAVYTTNRWKEVLILVTAFTLGHTLTLGISAVNGPLIKAEWVEFFIPVTIFITSVFNLLNPAYQQHKMKVRYSIALGFGLIHGMGFSNYFRMLLGKEASIIQPLFAFNLGVEVGQLIIVSIILGGIYSTIKLLNRKQRDVSLVLSGAAAGVALILMLETGRSLL